jgi:hypothetical protein
MPALKTFLVTTTIRVPDCLHAIGRNVARFGHQGVRLVVAGDRKTPPSVGRYVSGLKGFSEVDYLSLPVQEKFLHKLGRIESIIPRDSIQRRNAAYLYAFAQGAELIISVDDDVYPGADDFIGRHFVAGASPSIPCFSSPGGWFNVCVFLNEERGIPVYIRGFPYSKRGLEGRARTAVSKRRVAVNVGLWTENPDVNAASNLEFAPRITGVSRKMPASFTLAPGTLSPFDSQNTAFIRDTMPAMFLFITGRTIGGYRVGRYDDIWMSYFLRMAADRVGDAVTFGRPVTKHVRNSHNLVRDLAEEFPAILLTEKMLDVLLPAKLKSRSYSGCYLEIADILRSACSRGKPFTRQEAAYLRRIYSDMRAWVRAVRVIQPGI